MLLLTVLLFALLSTGITNAAAENKKTPHIEVSENRIFMLYEDDVPGDYMTIRAELDGVPFRWETDEEKHDIEWIVMIDSSGSVDPELFESEKEAIVRMYCDYYFAYGQRNARMLFFTFDSAIKQIDTDFDIPLRQALPKVLDKIECKGEKTAFYDALKAMCEYANSTKSKHCIPVIFSDGHDTGSETTREEITALLKEVKTPIYGFYPKDATKGKKELFKQMIEMTGGELYEVTAEDAWKKALSVSPIDGYPLEFITDEPIEENDHAELVIYNEDDEVIDRQTIAVKAWSPKEKAATADKKSETHEDPAGVISAKTAVPVVLLALIVLFVIVMAKKKSNAKRQQKQEQNAQQAPSDKKGSDKKIKVQFYFDDNQ